MKKIILFSTLILAVLTVQSQNVIHGEYFIDSEPGFGNATPFTIALPDSEITQSLNIPYSAFPSPGYHYVFTRTLDNNGNWSITRRKLVEADDNSGSFTVINVEYFFDTDNSFGSNSSAQLIASTDSTWNFNIPFNQLPLTWTPNDTVFLRVQDNIKGNWSITTTIDSINFTMVGIAENNLPGFNFYPNPATDFVTIELKENPSMQMRLSLTNLLGETLFERDITDRITRINLNHPPGIYFMNIKNSEENLTRKIVLH